MASFYIPLTGLNSDSTALNTIANDLANMNTTGFKSQSVNFSDLFYQQIGTTGAGNPVQRGFGTQVASIDTDFTAGSPNSTGLNSNVALTGAGFFVVSDGSAQYLTRAGNFETDAQGNLVTSNGLSVMGYPAVKGVVNTNAPLAAINIPETQVQPPQASSTFSMSGTLNSSANVGDSVSQLVPVYDSLGREYQATVTYTKAGTNSWNYSVTLPDTLTSAPAAAGTVVTGVSPTTTTGTPNDTYAFDFADGNDGALATVDGTSTLSIGGTAVTIPGGGESVSALAGQINGLGVAGVSANVVNGVLTVTVPTGTAVTPGLNESMQGSTINYNFGSNAGTPATVDPSTNITITGQTANGSTATITAPPISANESVGAYATALNNALSAAGIIGVNVNSTSAQLTITGSNMTVSGSLAQEPVPGADASGTLNFDANGNLISPATDVSGISFAGLSDGAATLNMTWDLFGTNGTALINQVNQASTSGSTPTTGTFSNPTTDGYPAGQYQDFSIGSDGTITASFSNGNKVSLGQLALANVSNLQGLNDMGNGDYQTTQASGAASIGISGTAGLGAMEGGALEGSNVNISAQFSDLIIAQRAFEANSKAVTTFDTVTQDTINMIH